MLDELQSTILSPVEMVVFFLVHSPEFLLTAVGFSDVKALESNCLLLICLEPSQTVIVV